MTRYIIHRGTGTCLDLDDDLWTVDSEDCVGDINDEDDLMEQLDEHGCRLSEVIGAMRRPIPTFTPTEGTHVDGASTDWTLHYGDGNLYVNYRGVDVVAVYLPNAEHGREFISVEYPDLNHWGTNEVVDADLTNIPETCFGYGTTEVDLLNRIDAIDAAIARMEAARLGKAAWKHEVNENLCDVGFDYWLSQKAASILFQRRQARKEVFG